MLQPRLWFLTGMVLYAVSMRVMPYVLYQFGWEIDPERTIYPWNFSPLTAMCLFGAAYLSDRRWSYLVPLGALVISDVCIGLLAGDMGFAIHVTTPFVYGCFALTITLGMWLRKRRSVLAIAGTGLLAETIFFFVTNFGVWLMYPTYTHDLTGLMACYVAGLPFFGRSLVSTALFSTLFFSRLALTAASTDQLATVSLRVTEQP